MSSLAHIIWDWNGTLLDDTWLCREVINGLLRARGRREIDLETYRKVFGFPVKDYYRRLDFDFEAESWDHVATEFVEAYEARRDECGLREGAEEALAWCAETGIGQSILSAYPQARLEEVVVRFGLGRYFTCLSGLDNHYADGKSGTARRLVTRLGFPANRVLLIGDTLHDFEVANELGARCLLITGGHHSVQKLAQAGPPVIHALADIPGILSDW